MIAAVTQRVVQDAGTGEIRDALSHDWYHFLNACGFSAILPIPNIGEQAERWLKLMKPDVLILSGGNDVEYGQRGLLQTTICGQIRDTSEAALLSAAISLNISVIGVCRGMQFIYAYFGGQLFRLSGHVGTVHPIKLVQPESNQESIVVNVNSYHNYGIEMHNMPDGLRVIGYDLEQDGVEAFVHEEFPLLGIMWHPERNTPFDQRDIEMVKTLMKRE